MDEPADTRSGARRRLAVALAAVAGLGGVAAGQIGTEPELASADVPSYWNDVAMTCATTSIALPDRDLELFECSHHGPSGPEPGRYDQSETTWYSDVDGRRARAHDIVITESGAVRGWALY